jgi:CheY-like chemotaxis protein
MFLSRIREAARGLGLPVSSLPPGAELAEACRDARPSLVLADLDSPRRRAAEAVAALRADPELATLPVVGFFSHVHAEKAEAARAAGFTRVLPRSAFVKALADILASAARAGEAPGGPS